MRRIRDRIIVTHSVRKCGYVCHPFQKSQSRIMQAFSRGNWVSGIDKSLPMRNYIINIMDMRHKHEKSHVFFQRKNKLVHLSPPPMKIMPLSSFKCPCSVFYVLAHIMTEISSQGQSWSLLSWLHLTNNSLRMACTITAFPSWESVYFMLLQQLQLANVQQGLKLNLTKEVKVQMYYYININMYKLNLSEFFF